MAYDTTPYRNIDLQTGTSTLVRNSPGVIDNYFISNAAAATRFIKIYDKVGALAASDTPKLTLALPAGASANAANLGWRFTNAISIRATANRIDADDTAPTAGDVIVNLGVI